MSTIERRSFVADGLELRSEGSGLSFRGYAAVFDSPSADLGGFTETVRRGAFQGSLTSDADIRLLWNHDNNVVLGSTRAGTLKLREDGHGLLAEADLPDNEWGRPVRDAIRRGDVRAMSIGFYVRRDEWSQDRTKRTLTSVDLLEVSPVVWPAYAATEASVRALAEQNTPLADALRALVAGDPTREQRDAIRRFLLDRRAA